MGRTAGPGSGVLGSFFQVPLQHCQQDVQPLPVLRSFSAKSAGDGTDLLNLDRINFPVLEQPQDSLTQPESQTRERLDDIWDKHGPSQMPM